MKPIVRWRRHSDHSWEVRTDRKLPALLADDWPIFCIDDPQRGKIPNEDWVIAELIEAHRLELADLGIEYA